MDGREIHMAFGGVLFMSLFNKSIGFVLTCVLLRLLHIGWCCIHSDKTVTLLAKSSPLPALRWLAS